MPLPTITDNFNRSTTPSTVDSAPGSRSGFVTVGGTRHYLTLKFDSATIAVGTNFLDFFFLYTNASNCIKIRVQNIGSFWPVFQIYKIVGGVSTLLASPANSSNNVFTWDANNTTLTFLVDYESAYVGIEITQGTGTVSHSYNDRNAVRNPAAGWPSGGGVGYDLTNSTADIIGGSYFRAGILPTSAGPLWIAGRYQSGYSPPNSSSQFGIRGNRASRIWTPTSFDTPAFLVTDSGAVGVLNKGGSISSAIYADASGNLPLFVINFSPAAGSYIWLHPAAINGFSVPTGSLQTWAAGDVFKVVIDNVGFGFANAFWRARLYKNGVLYYTHSTSSSLTDWNRPDASYVGYMDDTAVGFFSVPPASDQLFATYDNFEWVPSVLSGPVVSGFAMGTMSF